MKKSTTTLFIALLVIVAGISSCTMEKRLYRPGYYVSHKKSKAEPTRHEHPASEAIVAIEKKEVSPVTEKQAPAALKDISENKTATENKTSALPAFSGESKKETNSSLLHKDSKKTFAADKKLNPGSSIQQKNHSASGRDGGGNRAVRGLMMILIALLLLGLGAVFGIVLMGGGTGGLLVFWLFGLAATIMIIVGFVMIILGLAGA